MSEFRREVLYSYCRRPMSDYSAYKAKQHDEALALKSQNKIQVCSQALRKHLVWSYTKAGYVFINYTS